MVRRCGGCFPSARHAASPWPPSLKGLRYRLGTQRRRHRLVSMWLPSAATQAADRIEASCLVAEPCAVGMGTSSRRTSLDALEGLDDVLKLHQDAP